MVIENEVVNSCAKSGVIKGIKRRISVFSDWLVHALSNMQRASEQSILKLQVPSGCSNMQQICGLNKALARGMSSNCAASRCSAARRMNQYIGILGSDINGQR